MTQSPTEHDFGIVAAADAGDAVLRRMRMLKQHGPDWLTTPWPSLDGLVGGLRQTELIVLAARPGAGKTALGLNLITGLARAGVPVVFFSLEMGRLPLMQRIISAEARVPGHRIRDGLCSAQETSSVEHAVRSLSGLPLYIDDTPHITVDEIRERTARLRSSNGVRAAVVDYTQIVASSNPNQPRHIQIGDITVGLKRMARELEIPVVSFAQLNRMSEHREGGRPRMGDLRESGSIEQDADVVMLLHREALYRQQIGDHDWFREHERDVNAAEIVVAKNRNGQVGSCLLTWDEQRTRFIDPANAERKPPPPQGSLPAFMEDEE